MESMMTAGEIRKKFLDFFESKGHKIVPSAPIVVKNDPTLMFTNAGMNQFKDLFLGNKTIEFKRVADTQKCLRVSGKHNDLEEVGVDTYHHTMFEMLGNWSFGDPASPAGGYFKKESIAWGWELLTEIYKLDKTRLYVTVFEGDEKEKLDFDEEAFNEWKKHLPEERILKGNKKDNFWEMGDTGPCGPCSEIHYDMRTDAERKKTDGKLLVNANDPQVIEIWNHVFMQFERRWKSDEARGIFYDWDLLSIEDNSEITRNLMLTEATVLKPLAANHVDTGMGFERLVRALQGKTSNYDTDVFMPLIKRTEELSGIKYSGGDEKSDIAFRVIADHIRAVSFCIADNQLPGNTGAGYVIKRILRRAIRYGYSFLNFKQPFFNKLVEVLSDQMQNVFPELSAQKEFVAKVIFEEETSFLNTLEKGLMLIDKYPRNFFANEADKIFGDQYDPELDPAKANFIHAQKSKYVEDKINSNAKVVIDGITAFELLDTYGIPYDLTRLIAQERGWDIDENRFLIEMKKQKERSRNAGIYEQEDWEIADGFSQTEFCGYNQLESKSRITQFSMLKRKEGFVNQIVLDKTPFYAEAGGQVGDTGTIEGNGKIVNVINTKMENGLIVHYIDAPLNNLNLEVIAKVDADRRRKIEYNHTATHLLHAALRNVLGIHVQQKGSYVGPDRLRFDFSHFAKLTEAELIQIENLINQKIREDIPVIIRSMPIEEAKKLGAMMLFGEKYGDFVRVVEADENYSKELCGGTHVRSTGNIGYCKIISETAVAAGVRRIEAVTGDGVTEYINGIENTLKELAELTNAPFGALKGVQSLINENKNTEVELSRLYAKEMQNEKLRLKELVKKENGVNTLFAITSLENAEHIKKVAYELRNEIDNLFCVLGGESNGKANITIIISENLVEEKKLDAGKMVRELGKLIDGGGGGQKFFASAGGKNPAGLNAVMEKVGDYLKTISQ